MRRSTVIGCRERPAPTETVRARGRDTRRARSHAPAHTSPRAVEERRLSRARLAGAAQERRRVARDLHDGIQNELVSLILGLSLAEDDRNTSPELAANLSVLRARAQSTLSGIREIAHGIRPPLLAAAGVIEALRAQAALATVNLVGAAPAAATTPRRRCTSPAWRRFRTWPSTHPDPRASRSDCATATGDSPSGSRTTAAGSSRS